MSRVGKKPVPIPSGVTAVVEGQTVKLKGPKGALSVVLHGDVAVRRSLQKVLRTPEKPDAARTEDRARSALFKQRA